MSDTVYIEVDPLTNQWLNENCFSAYSGFNMKGYDIKPYTFSQLQSGQIELDPSIPVVGTIRSVKAAIKALGFPEPKNLDIPESLKTTYFLRRKVWYMTLKEARDNESLWPVFVKPADWQKAFTGFVLEDFRGCIKLAGFPEDMRLMCSTPVTFKNEWRAFVHQGKLLDVRPYAGNPCNHSPPEMFFQNIFEALYTDEVPVAYSIDVGFIEIAGPLSSFPEVVLIELNDSFSLGTYGLRPHLYVKMLEDRWREITSTHLKAVT